MFHQRIVDAAIPSHIHRGVVLTEDLAVEIYKYKVAPANVDSTVDGFKNWGNSTHVSQLFDVSPKTVRDIWNHVTWKYCTFPLWRHEDKQKIPNGLSNRAESPKVDYLTSQ